MLRRSRLSNKHMPKLCGGGGNRKDRKCTNLHEYMKVRRVSYMVGGPVAESA